MLLSPDLHIASGPPPQAVLNQRWLWQVLIFMLGVTLVLRLLGLDIAGALLTGLMLGFAVIMLQDGMKEIGKYALVYAVLSSLNFFFDILPLLTQIGGRVQRQTSPGRTITSEGVSQTTVTILVKTNPFFDASQGFLYNVQGAAMIASPLCMLLGSYLSICAHNENVDDEYGNDERSLLAADVAMPFGSVGSANSRGAAAESRPQGAGRVRGSQGPRSGPTDFTFFQGSAHKLGT